MALGIDVDTVVTVTALPTSVASGMVALHVVATSVPTPTLVDGRPQ